MNSDSKQKTIHIIGLMSGTSLDGLDICCVKFNTENYANFDILKAKTYSYSDNWKQKLANAHLLNGFDLMQLNHDFGVYCGEKVNEFCQNEKLNPNLISSHGHTVFHQPKLGFTTQIGAGAAIYATTGIQTVSDLRSVDVAFGGQGAPLVPIGDVFLFGEYEACLNLGGISNISVKTKDAIIAQDLGYCNLLLNHFSEKYFDKAYDKGGENGKKGRCKTDLLQKMLVFTSSQKGNSLAREDFELLLNLFPPDISPNDALTTSYFYIAHYLGAYFEKKKLKNVLLTGGGTHNDFLVQLLKENSKTEIIIPKTQIIDFKEALIFALLGLLRISQKPNSLRSVTKASKDCIGGAVYG
jgi:anhydro-N-acetylmuramic acid kinase